MFLPWRNAPARVARIQGQRDESLRAHERWAGCAQCGSRKVKTVCSRDFRPSSLPAPTATESPALPTVFPVGTRVTVHVLGYRGLAGAVKSHGKRGYTVVLDDGRTVPWVPDDKVRPLT